MTKDSKELEVLVAKIQRLLAPTAEVVHNIMLDGHLSSRKRQIDVLVRQKVGQYEIIIVIDCKDYAKPVDVKGIEEFDGLLKDVRAQKGVLVCPKGFTSAAKNRAEGLGIELYSPVDTDSHKWQTKITMTTICDFRRALISFGVSTVSPMPFRLPMDFFASMSVFDKNGTCLGTALAVAAEKWNSGKFPMDVGQHNNLKVFDVDEILVDNGYGARTKVDIYVSILVCRDLYYGEVNIKKISGFKDERVGGIITNAFQFDLLDPDEVENTWTKIEREEDAPGRATLTFQGLILWDQTGQI